MREKPTQRSVVASTLARMPVKAQAPMIGNHLPIWARFNPTATHEPIPLMHVLKKVTNAPLAYPVSAQP
ncbi:hypothetical protein GCM10027275_10010 [Rhabdobacter roseus]